MAVLAGTVSATPAVARDVVSVSGSGGGVTATLTTTPDSFGYATHTSIMITGAASYSARVPSLDDSLVAAGSTTLFKVSVRDLNGDGTPEVVVSSFSGGAHCCSVASVFRKLPGNRYKLTSQNFASEGYALKPIGTHVAFVSEDPRFEYAFTSYADSVEPIQIWRYTRKGTFADVTRTDRRGILRDLARTRRLYKHVPHGSSARGALGAYLADLLLARRRGEARSVLASAQRSGILKRGGDIPKSVPAYTKLVRRSLSHWGYGRL